MPPDSASRPLPKFDLESPTLRERTFGRDDSTVARWLREPYDLDGRRIDVANMTGRYGQHDHANTVARAIRAGRGQAGIGAAGRALPRRQRRLAR
jgi:glycosidase